LVIQSRRTKLHCHAANDPKFIARAVSLLSSRLKFHEAAMYKKGDQLQTKAEELRTNADNIRAEECHPDFALELAELAEELADQRDALAVTMAGYCKFA